MTKSRHCCIFLIFMLSVINSYAQQKVTSLAKAFYKFSYIIDTTKRNEPIQREMVLYMGKNASLLRNSLDEESKPLLYVSKGGSMATFDILEESASLIQIEGKTHRVERLIDNMYVISEKQLEINWKLENDTKMINGFRAQKATANIYGRHYTVWFTHEIPFQFGPWKLCGLPGLILDAEDNRGDVIFKFDRFQMINKDEVAKIAVPKSFKIKKVRYKDFENIYKAYYDDPAAFLKASLGITDDKSVVNGNKSSKERKYNNPIEVHE